MAEKFAITAELQLLLDSGIDSKLKQLRDKAQKSGVAIPITVNESSLKNFYREIDLIQNSARRSRKFIGIKVGLDNSSLKDFYKELNTVFESSRRSRRRINFKVGLDNESLKQFYRELNSVFNSARISKRAIPIKVALDNISLKNFYNELKVIYQGLKKSINISINTGKTQELNNLKALLDNFKSKVISLRVDLNKAAIDNIINLGNSLTFLDKRVKSFSTQDLVSIATSINNLASISKRKLTFDLSIKDSKAADALANSVLKVDSAFTKAGQSGGNFKVILADIINSINGLKTAAAGINFQGLNQATNSITGLTNKAPVKTQQQLSGAIDDTKAGLYDLGVQSAITVKRFAAYTLVTAGFFRLSSAVRAALGAFVDFDKQLTTIRQVTKQSRETTKLLGDEVGRLATSYGVSSQTILESSQVLAQAGFASDEVRIALEALAKSEVAPTFKDAENTVEAAIAAMAQFNLEVDDLESNLSSINSVAAAFAVEAEDITTAIQKAGGGFAAAGGSLEELQALFTSVRSTTRESADTIATGFRTIFTRLQRPRTAKFLEDFGISIRATAEDAERLKVNVGDFIGPFEAIRRISEATSRLSSADPRFAQIVEELGGFRQINKVIPLLQQFETSERALAVAQQNRNSLTEDAIIAQESYANQLTKVREEFLLLIREIADDKEIKKLITNLLDLTRAGLQVAKTFKDLIPLLTIPLTFRLVGAGKTFGSGFGSRFLKRNEGGIIPGRGPNRDTVMGALTPGEYVIQRDAVDFYGKRFLDNINNQRLNSGGPVGFNKGGFVGGYQSGGVVSDKVLKFGGAALLLGGLLEGGFVKALLNAEEATKEFTFGVLGAVAQAGLFFSIFKNFNQEIAKASKRIDKFARQQFVTKGNKGLSQNRTSIRNLAQDEKFRFIDLGGNQRLSNLKSSSRNERISSRLINNFSVEAQSRAGIAERNLRGGERVFGTRDSASLRKQIASLEATLAQNTTIYNNAIKQDPIIPTRVIETSSRKTFSNVEEAEEFHSRQLGNFDITQIRKDNDGIKKQIDLLDRRAKFIERNTQAAQKYGDIVNRNNISDDVSISGSRGRREVRIGEIAGQRELARQTQFRANTAQFLVDQRTKKRNRFERIRNLGFGRGRPSDRFLNRVGGAAAFGGVAASFAGNQILSRSLATEDRVGSRTGSAVGGALAKGGQFAAAGAAFGSLFGPLGTAIGGAGGGLVGAIYGAVDAMRSFETSVKNVASQTALKDLDRIFKGIEGGKTTAATSNVSFVSNLSSLQNVLQSTSDQDVRADTLSGLKGNSVNIQTFVNEVAKSSKTLDDFSNKIPPATQTFIASILGIPLVEFQDEVQNSIKANIDFTAQQERSAQSIKTFDDRIRAALAFSQAFRSAALSVNTFKDNLESFAFGGTGVETINNPLSDRLTNLDLIDDKSLNSLNKFLFQFNDIGRTLGQETTDSAKLAQAIPGILLDLRSQSAFAEEGDIESRFSEAISKLNLSSNTGANLVNSRLEELLGEDFKDSNFFKSLNTDFPKAVQDLTQGLTQIPEIVSEAYAIANERLNAFSQGLDKGRQLTAQLFEGQLKTFDNINSAIQARATFTGRNPDDALVQNAFAREQFVTGGRDPQQLRNQIFQARGNIQGLQQNLNNQEDLQNRQGILNAINNEKAAIENATRALNFLANSTDKLNTLQNKQATLRSQRETRRDLATDFAFGSSTDKTRIVRTRQNARLAASTGDISSFSQEDKQSLLQFLQQFSDQEVSGGLRGRDIIDKIIQNTPELPKDLRESIRPSTEEQKLQTLIENQIAEQNKAQQALNSIIISDRQAFFQQLNQDFSNFIKQLDTSLAEQSAKENIQQFREVASERQNIGQQLAVREQLESKFGVEGLANLSQLQEVAKKLKEAQASNFAGAFTSLQSKSIGVAGPGGSISLDKFQVLRDATLSNLSDKDRQTVSGKLEQANLGLNSEKGTLNLGLVTKAFVEALNAGQAKNKSDIVSLTGQKSDIEKNIGGEDRLLGAAKAAVLLESRLDPTKIPEKTSDELRKEFQALTEELNKLNDFLPKNRQVGPNRPRGFNTGGLVPGIGNSDTVPALLTPKEFVVTQQGVKNIGLQTLRRANSGAKKFQDGGLVPGSQAGIINSEVVNRFNSAINQLSIQVEKIRDVFASLPTEITMVGRHTVDVNINGAQAFAGMQSTFANLVKSEVNKSINKLLKNKFPELGQFDG